MTNLPTLIEKVKALTGADREVDAEIEIAFGPCGPDIRRIMSGSPHNTICDVARYADSGGPLFRIPRYTASVDAALSLVPEGWGFMLAAHDDGGHAYAAGCFPYQGDAEDCGAISPTPALALAIAALQARIGGEG